MFTINKISLRPLEPADIDTLYAWETDLTLSYYAGWTNRLSRCAFRPHWEQRLSDPPEDLVNLGIALDGRLVGYVQLAHIDFVERRAEIGIVIGEAGARGQGVGTTAVRILCDYAFTVKGLTRVCGQTYGFNQRAQRMFARAGFTPEGVLRQHELHNGIHQDLHVFGMLRDEFYARYETIFKPEEKL